MSRVKFFVFRILPLLLLLASSNLYAQTSSTVSNRPRNEERFIRFGIGIGLNVMDFRLLNSGVLSKPPLYADSTRFYGTVKRLHPGFNVNALMRFRINNNMHVRILPGICFGQRDITFYNIGKSGDREWEDIRMPIESSYIEMPILFCYSVPRHSNVRPYVCVGVNVMDILLSFVCINVKITYIASTV